MGDDHRVAEAARSKGVLGIEGSNFHRFSKRESIVFADLKNISLGEHKGEFQEI